VIYLTLVVLLTIKKKKHNLYIVPTYLKYTNYQEHNFTFQIDKSILALMDINDTMLLKLIPHYGDRLAVLDFVKKNSVLNVKQIYMRN